MSFDPDREPIRVNEILGKQASFGPVPANQILPWILIITLTYLICDGFLGWGLPVVGAISFWSIASWWLLTGKDPDNFLNLFRKPKKRNWTMGGALYISPLLSRQERRLLKRRMSSRNKRYFPTASNKIN